MSKTDRKIQQHPPDLPTTPGWWKGLLQAQQLNIKYRILSKSYEVLKYMKYVLQNRQLGIRRNILGDELEFPKPTRNQMRPK